MRTLARVLVIALTSAMPFGGASLAGDATHRGPHNWGRWGADDELGAANLITPQRIAAAARLIKTGKTFSLAIPIDQDGPVFPGRLPPHHTMVISGADYAAGSAGFSFGDMKFADDYIYMPLQGSTQWDGLAHGWYGEHLYNGVPQTAVRGAPASGGATKLGIENLKSSLVGRAVLIDVLRDKGGSLPEGYGITRADLDAALTHQGTKVQPGDIVVIRTGYVPAFYRIEDPVKRFVYLSGPQTGLAQDVVGWVKEHDVAALAADNLALEALPNPDDPEKPVAMHGNLLRDLGVYIGEIWWLEELAEDCAKDKRWEFFLAAQPLNIPGAVGSPLNPIAIK